MPLRWWNDIGVMGDVCITRGKVEQYKRIGVKAWRKDVPLKFEAGLPKKKIISQ
jgi:hypothetical protein